MKENILILNRMGYRHYCKNNDPIIDYSKYNVFVMTKKDRAKEFPETAYNELFSFDLNDDDYVLELAKQLHKKYPISYVLALSERNLLVAGKIRDYCNCAGMSYDEVLKYRNKCYMKKILYDNGIKVPIFSKITSNEIAQNLFKKYKKVVIKPIFGMGSTNTYLIDSKEKLEIALNEIASKNSDYEIYEIEEFIEGDMYHLDSYIKNNQIQFCGIFKYLEKTIDYSASGYNASVMEDDQNIITLLNNFNQKVLNAFGLENGVAHHEIFLNNNEVTFCEIAARPGGAGIVPAIEEVYSVNLFEASICMQLEQKNPIVKPKELFSGFVIFYPKEGIIKDITPSDIFNKDWIPLFRIYGKVGDNLINVKHSADMLASFIITGKSKRDLMNKVEWIRDNFNVIYQ